MRTNYTLCVRVPHAPSYVFVGVCVGVLVCIGESIARAATKRTMASHTRCTVALSCRSRKTTIWLHLTSCVNFVIYHKTVC